MAKTLSHQEADRVPCQTMGGPAIAAMLDSMDLAPEHRAFCERGDIAVIRLEPEPDMDALRPYLPDLPEDAEVRCWGIGQLAQKSTEGWHAGYKLFHPLRDVNSLSELRLYPFPDYQRSAVYAGLEERIRALQAQEYTVVGSLSQSILETAYMMRGIPELMMDFYERPGYVAYLFEQLARQRIYQAQCFAEAGADVIRIGDDIATQKGLMVSPALYRDRIKPFHLAIVEAARKVNSDIEVIYHSDGNLTALIPDLIEIGVTILNPVQPECMDLAGIKKEYGRDLGLWGCMPVQSVFANGGRDEVLAHLRFLMREIAPGGGLVLEFTNFLETARSLENLRVFFEEFYDIGRCR